MAEEFRVTGETKLSEILKKFPKVIEEAAKIDSRAKMINNPLVKMMIGKLTVHDLFEQAKKANMPLNMSESALIAKINEMIKKFDK